MDRRAQLWQSSGVAAVVVTMGAILFATLLSPSFRLRGNALSNLGTTETAAGTELTALLFNGGLILGGVLGIVFGSALWRAAQSVVDRVTGVSFGMTTLFMGLVGVFPQETAPHFPVAVTFYVLISVTLWLDALARFRRGHRRPAALAGTLGTANLAGWVVWGLTGDPLRPGLAIPEVWGALVFSAWTVWVSAGLLGRG